MSAPPRPRVLLVDDDAAIRRLVALALEDEALELIACADVESALDRLAETPVSLLITDLMMPGLSGFDLLERLQAQPALRGAARLVAFSAGLSSERVERLKALGVDALLDKPVAVAVLLECVLRLLGSGGPAPGEAAPLKSAAVPVHFGGDAALYASFLQACLAQYPQDLLAGEAALQQGDGPALRRVAHNLKGSLRLLGEEGLAELAHRVEQQALTIEPLDATVGEAWRQVQEALRRFVEKSAI